MQAKGKYLSWGNFLKSRREKRFRSAREFCSQVPVGISYPQYSRYECGDQLPSLDQALSLCATLGVPPMEALLEWSLAQVPSHDALTREGVTRLLSEVRGAPTEDRSALPGWPAKMAERTVPLDDVIVFNRSHLRLFISDPAYRDIFTYINSFGPHSIPAGEIAEALGLDADRARRMLEELTDLGVIVSSGDGMFRASKRNFYFPDDEDFFALRNVNMAHNTSRIMDRLRHPDLVSRNAYRGLVTRELTDEQVRLLLEGVDQLMSGLVAMPETDRPRTIYSLCVLFGERFSRAPIPSVPVIPNEENLR